jgi:hypothetical protein
MIRNLNVQMIEQIKSVRFVVVTVHQTSSFRIATSVHVTAHRKADRTVLLIALDRITPSDRHIVDNEVMLIVLQHSVHQEAQLFGVRFVVVSVRASAQLLASLLFQKRNIIRRRANTFAKHDLPQILDRRIFEVGIAKVKVTVLVRNDRLFRVEAIDEQFHFGFACDCFATEKGRMNRWLVPVDCACDGA